MQILKSFPYLVSLLLGNQLLLAWHSGFSEIIINFCIYIFGDFEHGSHIVSAGLPTFTFQVLGYRFVPSSPVSQKLFLMFFNFTVAEVIGR